MKRRDFIKQASVGAVASSAVAAPAIANYLAEELSGAGYRC